MSTVTPSDKRARAGHLARLSPLVLVAVALPWILEWVIVEAAVQFVPAYESLVTDGIGDAVLYPVVTGSITLLGLYAFLDVEARQSLFLFSRPSRRELRAVVVAVIGGLLLSSGAQAVVITVFDVASSAGPGIDPGLRSLLLFALVGGVFAPLVEEVLFRGLLLEYLIERGIPTLVAAGVVVAAFGAIHYYGGIGQITSATVFGAVLVALRLRYDNLTVPVLAHALNNLLFIPLILLLT